MTRYERRFRRVARSLSRVELMRSSMDEISALTDVELMDADAGRRFLDSYGDEGLQTAFERYGLTAAIARRGWSELVIQTFADADRHTLLVDGHTADGKRDRLVELVVRRDRLQIEDLDSTWEVLTVDWLTLRDPLRSYSEKRMRLPGQDAPGLGVAERVSEMLYRAVRRLELDGLVNVPDHFHNAVLYSRELPYVDPWYQGHLEALMRLLLGDQKLSFAQAAWALEWGHVHDSEGRVLRWRGEAMLRAMDPPLRAYLASADYAVKVAKSAARAVYRLDRSGFDDRWVRERDSLVG